MSSVLVTFQVPAGHPGNQGKDSGQRVHYENGTYITDSCQLLPDIGLFYQTLGLAWADTMVINCKLGPHEVGSRIKRKKLPLMICIFSPHKYKSRTGMEQNGSSSACSPNVHHH